MATGPGTSSGASATLDLRSAPNAERGPPAIRFHELERLRSTDGLEVSRAYDSTLRREVVLARFTGNDQHPLLEVVRRLASLSHPNIAGLHDVGFSSGEMLVALELVSGRTAAQVASEASSWRAIVDVLLEAIAGLEHAHRHGVVHGNLDPDAIIVGDDGHVKVRDFAFTIHERMVAPAYRAPESCSGQTANAHSDQYAICAIAYSLLTGPGPSCPETPAPDPVSTSRARPRASEAPAALLAVLRRGRSPAPDQRYPSLTELRVELESAIARRRRASQLAYGSIPLVIASSVVLWGWYRNQAKLCSGAERLIAEAWGSTQRTRVERAFRATNATFAEPTLTRVLHLLDRYAAAWSAHHHQACRATAIERIQSSQDLDLRMGCLQRVKLELGSTVTVLARADTETVTRSGRIVAGLPDLERCSDLALLRAVVPPPEDPEVARKVEQIRARIAEATALDRAGKVDEGLALVIETRSMLGDVPYRPIHAELYAREMVALDRAGRWRDSARAVARAFDAALESVSEPRLVARIASQAAYAAAAREHRHAEALRLAELALAFAAPLDDGSRAEVHSHIGAVFYWLGRWPDAKRELRYALELKKHRSDEYEIARARRNLSTVLLEQGRAEEAERLMRASVAWLERAYGESHPDVALALTTFGHSLGKQGKWIAAERTIREALAIQREVLPASHPYIGESHNEIGYYLTQQGRYAEAEQHLRTALDAWLEASPNYRNIGFAYTNLGYAYLEQERYRSAEREFLRSLDFREKLGVFEVYKSHEALGHLWHIQGHLEQAYDTLRTARDMARRAHGERHPETAAPTIAFARIALARGELDIALRELEIGWALQNSHSVPPERRADTAFTLARLLWRMDGDRARIRDLIRHAESNYRAAHPPRERDAELVAQWVRRTLEASPSQTGPTPR